MGLRILLAEDDSRLNELLCAAAQARGHSTISVERGDLVVPRALSDRPEVIVLDLNMPMLDGRDVLSRLKSDPLTRGTPVVVMTGRTDEYTRDLCMQYGAAEFVSKPVVMDQLVTQVEQAVQRARAAQP